jgi:hypothetical protein
VAAIILFFGGFFLETLVEMCWIENLAAPGRPAKVELAGSQQM